MGSGGVSCNTVSSPRQLAAQEYSFYHQRPVPRASIGTFSIGTIWGLMYESAATRREWAGAAGRVG